MYEKVKVCFPYLKLHLKSLKTSLFLFMVTVEGAAPKPGLQAALLSGVSAQWQPVFSRTSGASTHPRETHKWDATGLGWEEMVGPRCSETELKPVSLWCFCLASLALIWLHFHSLKVDESEGKLGKATLFRL